MELLIVVPLVITVLLLGSITFSITKRLHETNPLPSMQFQTIDLIVSSLCIATTWFVIYRLAHGNCCEEGLAMILFTLAGIFGLLNGKWWSLMRDRSTHIKAVGFLLLGFVSSVSLAFFSGGTLLFLYLVYFYSH